jgi:hypothetical protein
LQGGRQRYRVSRPEFYPLPAEGPHADNQKTARGALRSSILPAVNIRFLHDGMRDDE